MHQDMRFYSLKPSLSFLLGNSEFNRILLTQSSIAKDLITWCTRSVDGVVKPPRDSLFNPFMTETSIIKKPVH